MTPIPALAAGIALLALGGWLYLQPARARRRVADAEAGHRTRVSLYEAHFGEDPDWADAFVAPPLALAGRHPLPFRLAGLAAMGIAAAFLYNRLSRLGVI